MSSKRADRAGRNRGSRHETQVLWMVVGTVKLYGVSLLVFVFLHTSIDQSYTAFIHVGSNETSDERRADCERSLSPSTLARIGRGVLVKTRPGAGAGSVGSREVIGTSFPDEGHAGRDGTR